MNSPLVTLENVSKYYKNLPALSSINLQLAQGEVLGLFGHNGAGKNHHDEAYFRRNFCRCWQRNCDGYEAR